MKKGFIAVLVAVVLVFSVGTPLAYAGIDLEGEFNYEVDEEAIDGYTEIVANGARGPWDLSLTWRRDWVPVQEDSLMVDLGVSLGYLRLGYEREVVGFKVGVASLVLTIDPFTFGYARTLDGVDEGTFTLSFAKSL